MTNGYRLLSIAAAIVCCLTQAAGVRAAEKKRDSQDNLRIETRFLTVAKEIQSLPDDEGKAGIRALFNSREARRHACIQQLGYLTEEVLGEPDSPYCNEEMFITALEELLKSRALTEEEKTRPRLLLETALKNRPGCPAHDFSFQLRNGETSTLYDIQSPYILLFFNDPDCDRCTRVKKILAADKTLNLLLEEKRISVLGIYPFWDVELWQEQEHYLPENWTDGCDMQQQIMENTWYDLKTSPVLYLLDGEKKVLIKNGTPRSILNYLNEHAGAGEN